MSWLWLLPVIPVTLGLLLVLLLHLLFLSLRSRSHPLPGAPLFIPVAANKQLAVFEEGSGETQSTLLFLHGSPASSSAFTAQLRHPFRGCRRVSIDRLGYGQSDGEQRDACLSAQTEAVQELIKKRSYPKVVLVGHSYGAPLAVSVALQNPEVIGVVLIGGCFDPADEKPWLLQYWGASPLISWSLPRAVRQCNLELLRLKPELESLNSRLHSLTCPVLMLHGDQDDRVPVGSVTYLANRFRSCGQESLFHQKIYPHADHFLPWRQAEKINQDVAQFLELALNLETAVGRIED